MSLDAKRYKNVSTSWGDADPTFRKDGANNDTNFASDSGGFPLEGFIENKFMVNPNLGASGELYPAHDNDNKQDFAQDSAGVVNPNMGESTDMALSFEPNKFPRQTGHDSLTTDEDLLT